MLCCGGGGHPQKTLNKRHTSTSHLKSTRRHGHHIQHDHACACAPRVAALSLCPSTSQARPAMAEARGEACLQRRPSRNDECTKCVSAPLRRDTAGSASLATACTAQPQLRTAGLGKRGNAAVRRKPRPPRTRRSSRRLSAHLHPPSRPSMQRCAGKMSCTTASKRPSAVQKSALHRRDAQLNTSQPGRNAPHGTPSRQTDPQSGGCNPQVALRTTSTTSCGPIHKRTE